jgi:hypothetical protein
MTEQQDFPSVIVIDGAFNYLRGLDPADRIPRFRPNGLPARAPALDQSDEERFNRLGAPDTIQDTNE